MASPSLADVVLQELTHYLGPHTAKNALKTFAEKALGKSTQELTRKDAPELLSALRPMLRTLLGAERCEEVLANITRELEG
jgi:hypothetical protein